MFSHGKNVVQCNLRLRSRLNRSRSRAQRHPLGQAQAEERPMTVFIYVDSNKDVGDKDQFRVFASERAANMWFEENDPEGVAFEYEVVE